MSGASEDADEKHTLHADPPAAATDAEASKMERWASRAVTRKATSCNQPSGTEMLKSNGTASMTVAASKDVGSPATSNLDKFEVCKDMAAFNEARVMVDQVLALGAHVTGREVHATMMLAQVCAALALVCAHMRGCVTAHGTRRGQHSGSALGAQEHQGS